MPAITFTCPSQLKMLNIKLVIITLVLLLGLSAACIIWTLQNNWQTPNNASLKTNSQEQNSSLQYNYGIGSLNEMNPIQIIQSLLANSSQLISMPQNAHMRIDCRGILGSPAGINKNASGDYIKMVSEGLKSISMDNGTIQIPLAFTKLCGKRE